MWNLPNYLESLGNLLYLLGDYATALSHLTEGLALARAQGSRIAMGNLLCELTNVYCALGDLDRSRASLREGLLIARDVGLHLMKVHLVMAALSLWREMGKAEQAAEWLELLFNASGIGDEEQSDLQNQRAGLERELGSERLSAAIERGKTLDLDRVINNILAEL